jgi:hypothetical protein
MAKFAELPDGTRLEFPDNTSDSVIDSTVKKHLGVSVSPKVPTPEVSTGEAVGAGFLGSALGLSRFFGGDVAESQTKARKAEEVAMEQRPIATSVGKFIPSVIAATPGIVASAPLTAGMGVLGTMGVETALGGVPAGGGMGAEQYQRVLDATGDKDLALKSAMTTGAIGAVGVGAPASLGGGILKRMAGGAAINVPLSEAEIAAQNQLLKDYPTLQQEQFDPTNMALQGGLGAVFGALGPRRLGNKPPVIEKPTGKLDQTQESMKFMEDEQALIEAGQQIWIPKLENIKRQIAELEQTKATNDLDAESRLKLDELNEELKYVQGEVDKITTPIGTKVGEELPPKTDVNTPTSGERVGSDGTPLPDEQPTVRSDFDEPIEGVSRESDVPPDLQLLDRAIDGVDPNKVIQPEPRSYWEQHLDGLNDKIDDAQKLLDEVNDQLLQNEESGASFTPYTEGLENTRVRLEGLIDSFYDRVSDTKKLIAVEKEPSKVSAQDRSKLAVDAINEVLGDSNIKPENKPQAVAARLAPIFDGVSGTHYVGLKANKDTILSTVDSLNKITGQNDKIIIVHTPEVSKGSFHAAGNTAVMFVSDHRKTAFDAVRRFFKPEDVSKAALLHNIGHEYGHYYMTKIVQAYGTDTAVLRRLMFDFDKYKGTEGVERLRTISSMPLAEKLVGENYVKKAGYYDDFPEYFAEAFNRAINSGKLPDNPFLREMYTGLRKISDAIYEKLRGMGILVSKEDYTSQTINEYLASNRTYMTSAARTLDNQRIKSQIDSRLSEKQREAVNVPDLEAAQNQVHTYFKTKTDKDYVPVNVDKVVEEQKQVEDSSWLATKFATNFFGFDQIRQVLDQVPLIKAVARAINNADYKAEQISKALLHGVVDYANWKAESVRKGFITNLQHFKDMDSVASLLQRLPNADFARLEAVFRLGFNEGLDYPETLRKYGSMLNDQQKQAFTVMSTMFKRQWEEVTKLGINLPQRKGWYPSVRTGDHFLELKYNGVVVYRQQVRSLMEANRLATLVKESGKYKNLEVNTGKNPDNRAEMEQRQFITDAVLTELGKKGYSDARDVVEDLLDRLESKPKLGKHHEQRLNILGYKGTELFGNEDLRGMSFKEAIKTSADDYTGTLRKILISRETNPLINTPNGLDESHPNAFYAAKLVRDQALNRVEGWTPGFDDMVRGTFDKLFQKIAGKESKIPFYDRLTGVGTHIFYIQALTMKMGFWVSQVLSSPIALRHLLRESSIADSLKSAGKGTYNMVHPSEDFLNCVYWLSQNSNVYHPSLVNEITQLPMLDFLKEGTFTKKLVNVLTGETPSSMADSFSRYWTSAMMHAHYSELGYTGKALYQKVAEATDSTMVRYGKRYRAPFLKKLGIVGEAMAPLHTFSQAQWGNFVADIAFGKRTGNWAPLASTFLVSVALGGIIGAPLVAEYEFIRKAFGLEETMPSIVDLAMKSGSDSLTFGPLINTGFDMGSSLRTSALLPGMAQADASIMDLFPAFKFGGKVAENLGTIFKQKVGGSVSDAEYRAAVLQIMPKGWMTGLTEDVKFGATERRMVPTTSGQGLVPQTDKERAASYMGVRTSESAKEAKQYELLTQADKTRTEKIRKQIDILGDAISKGDNDKRLRAMEKLDKLGVRDSSIREQLMSELSGRERSLIERYIFGAKGKGTGFESQRRLFNFGDYE